MLAAVPGRRGCGGELGASSCARACVRRPGRAHLGEVEGCDDPPEPVAESLEQAEAH